MFPQFNVLSHVQRRGATFDPLTSIAWSHAYWAEGTEFTALGLADAGVVSTWPDEVGSSDLSEATNKPIYVASDATLNSKPLVRFDGVNDKLKGSFTSIPGPHTIVMIGRYLGGSTTTQRIAYDGASNYQNNLAISPSNYVTPNRFSIVTSVSATTASNMPYDNNPHLFRTLAKTLGQKLFVNEVDRNLTPDASNPNLTGLTMGARGDSTQFGQWDIAFLGVYAGELASITEFHEWAQVHYGVA